MFLEKETSKLKKGESFTPDSEEVVSPGDSHHRALWEKYFKNHDQESKEKLLSTYAYLVRYIIGRMKVGLVSSLDREDLESVGSIGLVKAMDRYDLSRNVKFETYAYRWVRGSVLDYLRKIDFLSRTSRERVKKFKNVYLQLTEKLGRDPRSEELQTQLGISSQDLNHLYLEIAHSSQLSLESQGTKSDSEEDRSWESLQDSREPDALHCMEKKESIDLIHDSIEKLPEKEKLVISLYYYDDMTFKEIAEIVNVSESRICQLHSKAVLSIQGVLERYQSS